MTRKEKIAQGIPKPYQGNRKAHSAAARKAQKKNLYYAIYWNCPYPPRKVRLVADLIRGQRVEKALILLKLTKRFAAKAMLKTLRCAINDWEQKTQNKGDVENLYVAHVSVDPAPFLKRIQPAPQGRAHPIRKRHAHIKIYLAEKTA